MESEGEAGDARMYAERANGAKGMNGQHQGPLPRFERSVFDMKYQPDHRHKFQLFAEGPNEPEQP